MIEVTNVARYHCHDRAFPVIECFSNAAARDADARSPDEGNPSTLADAVPYVIFYRDAGYGGPSLETYFPLPNLSSYGWDDMVTSFKSLNGQRPHWFNDAAYGKPSWVWPAGAWVSNVGGDANDRFSSVRNYP